MTDQLQPKPIHILLVDDDEDDRYLTKEAFHQHYPASRISFAEDGEDMLEFLKYEGRYTGADHPLPELILLDLNMPRLNGFEALKLLRNHPTYQATPIVILTTSEAEADRQQASGLGANDFITKPLNAALLGQIVDQLRTEWLVGRCV